MTKGYKEKAKSLAKKLPPFQGVTIEIVGVNYNFDNNNKTVSEQLKKLLDDGLVKENDNILFTFKEYGYRKLIVRSVKLKVKEVI